MCAHDGNRPRVIALDDDPEVLAELRQALQEECEVLPATTIDWAMEVVGRTAPDVGIIDLEFPGRLATDLMRDMALLNPAMDFILMTPSGAEIRSVLEALREHPFYYIEKPLDPLSIRVLVRRCLTKRELQDSYRRTRVFQDAAEEAQRLHEDLLPEDAQRIGDVSVHCLYRPALRLGGDFYDYAALRDEEGVAFLLADVTGHGFAPALLAGVIKTAFHEAQDRGHDPAAVLERIHRGLGVCTEKRHVTVFCGSYRFRDRVLRYANAGHPPGFVWGAGD